MGGDQRVAALGMDRECLQTRYPLGDDRWSRLEGGEIWRRDKSELKHVERTLEVNSPGTKLGFLPTARGCVDHGWRNAVEDYSKTLNQTLEEQASRLSTRDLRHPSGLPVGRARPKTVPWCG